jgi:hypothetical protein
MKLEDLDKKLGVLAEMAGKVLIIAMAIALPLGVLAMTLMFTGMGLDMIWRAFK